MNKLREFFCSHPAIIKAVEGLEHAGLDGAEELVLTALGQKFGILMHLFPVETIADAGKRAVEGAVDGALENVIAKPPGATMVASSAQNMTKAPPSQVDPIMRAKQEQAAQQARDLDAQRIKDAEAKDAGVKHGDLSQDPPA